MPEFIAAVMPTTRLVALALGARAPRRTPCVYCGGFGAPPAGFDGAGIRLAIEFGLAACHFSMPSRPPSSAGAKPLPLTVAQWTTTGRSASKAARSARRSARTSWPSMTPM